MSSHAPPIVSLDFRRVLLITGWIHMKLVLTSRGLQIFCLAICAHPFLNFKVNIVKQISTTILVKVFHGVDCCLILWTHLPIVPCWSMVTLKDLRRPKSSAKLQNKKIKNTRIYFWIKSMAKSSKKLLWASLLKYVAYFRYFYGRVDRGGICDACLERKPWWNL